MSRSIKEIVEKALQSNNHIYWIAALEEINELLRVRIGEQSSLQNCAERLPGPNPGTLAKLC